MMEKEELKQYMKQLQTKGSVYGLDTIKELLQRLGNPQEQLQIVHIAGTNGKGSTLAMIDSVVRNAGYNCGRYSSPTIDTYLERFQINGRYMEEKEWVHCMCMVIEQAQEMEQAGYVHPTAFEIETAVAFVWFLQKKVDLVLLETGLGGRMDATNVITKPIVTLFASISREHMGILGDTVEEITIEKSGIIKEGCPVIVYPNEQNIQAILKEQAKEHHSSCICIQKEEIQKKEQTRNGQVFVYQGEEFKISLFGDHQMYNATVAIEAIQQLRNQSFLITQEALKEGLRLAKWNGRFEVVQQFPDWILDGAHNEDAARKLKESLEQYVSFCFTKPRIFYIIGVFKDKEYETIVSTTAELADVIVTVEANDPHRTLASSELAQVARTYHNNVIDAKHIRNGIALVKELAKKEDLVIVFGTLSLLGEAKEAIQEAYGSSKSNFIS